MSTPVTHIASVVHDGDTLGANYFTSTFMDYTQACEFVRGSRYDHKACVSLNHVFVPYAGYDSDALMPSGGITGDVWSQGTTLTIGTGTYDAYQVIEPNSALGTKQNINNETEQRNVGLNRFVYFVGAKGDAGDILGNQVAGPLDLEWDDGSERWTMKTAKPEDNWVMGYVTDTSISAAPGPGQYSTFTVNGTATFRNYDVNLDVSSAQGIFVVGVRVSGVPTYNSSLGVYNQTYTSDTYLLPLYIGCGG